MTTARDPREDPQPGDVIRCDPYTFEVIEPVASAPGAFGRSALGRMRIDGEPHGDPFVLYLHAQWASFYDENDEIVGGIVAPTPPSLRDPRIDPHPGDVVPYGEQAAEVLTVQEWGREGWVVTARVNATDVWWPIRGWWALHGVTAPHPLSPDGSGKTTNLVVMLAGSVKVEKVWPRGDNGGTSGHSHNVATIRDAARFLQLRVTAQEIAP